MNKKIAVGNTPLARLSKIEEAYSLSSRLYAKVEAYNPAGSIKDRVALKMIEDYEKEGLISENTKIIEPTSGNTGIGLAMVCKERGYKAVIVMPDNMSRERIDLIASYGAEVVLTPGALGMKGAIEEANRIKDKTPDSIIAGQFENPSNPMAHYEGTGPEIYKNTEGGVDILVCGVGTGGTITGAGKYLKEQNPKIKVVAVEPTGSPVLSGGAPGAHGLQGIGAGFITKVLDLTVIDEIVTVTDDEAYKMTRELNDRENILAGISSGAALVGAIKIARNSENKDIVVILPDTGKRYLSLGIY